MVSPKMSPPVKLLPLHHLDNQQSEMRAKPQLHLSNKIWPRPSHLIGKVKRLKTYWMFFSRRTQVRKGLEIRLNNQFCQLLAMLTVLTRSQWWARHKAPFNSIQFQANISLLIINICKLPGIVVLRHLKNIIYRKP